ncbi:B box and SPRY domain-containing protein [Patagioenas fasciata monilis]|uniref:B box and SPRY domain-containing protein n=1 Tax=Patagioenas fasciata monilis TaxID=372326 RepID=A0A1V4J6S7_PATFA|nr:B box and SPRY domain-containing protein [Patagioenas fasciata monilis]
MGWGLAGLSGGSGPPSVFQNKIVDRCEQLQLQSAAIARHLETVLPAKDQGVLNAANAARELVIQRLLFVGNACENEEQRLLEKVHAEEERAHQSILTQRVHWAEALQKLGALRTYLVDMITNLDDQALVCAEQEIFERTELAEGILEPQESLKLNFNQTCVQSPLLHRLWASAVLCCGAGSQEIHIDEKTVSPHLSLSEDKKTLTFSPKKGKVNLDCPERFDHWPNALATLAFRSGICAWKVSVEQSCAYKLGVCYSSVPRKGSANEGRLGFNAASWVFSRYDKEFKFLHAGQPRAVELLKAPAEIGVLVDFAGGEVLFYDPDSCAILFSHRENFTEPLYPVFAVAHQSISLVQ